VGAQLESSLRKENGIIELCLEAYTPEGLHTQDLGPESAEGTRQSPECYPSRLKDSPGILWTSHTGDPTQCSVTPDPRECPAVTRHDCYCQAKLQQWWNPRMGRIAKYKQEQWLLTGCTTVSMLERPDWFDNPEETPSSQTGRDVQDGQGHTTHSCQSWTAPSHLPSRSFLRSVYIVFNTAYVVIPSISVYFPCFPLHFT
jgi:hypothetical protein